MASKSNNFVSQVVPNRRAFVDLSEVSQLGLVFALIMLAVWTPTGRVNAGIILLAALCILWLTARGGQSALQLGLARPRSGVALILISGLVCAAALVVAGPSLKQFGPAYPGPWNRAWQYVVWALMQEFILQSFFFLRLESLLGGRRAVWAAAFLFALTHLPGLLLTVLSFGAGLLFCEMFRRYRNIFPLGLVHGALGLTVAACLPDPFLHHMRVGLGYLSFHP